MDDNLTIFLIMTVAITAAFLLTVIRLKSGRRSSASEEERRQVIELAGENERLRTNVSALEQRLEVLERIATDPAHRTALEIEGLR
jgi:Flp pilus assembly protein CpaB